MHVSFPARSVPVAIFAVMLALVLMVASSDRAYAAFTPTGTISVVDPSPGANSDIVADFNIQSPSVNFGGLIAFSPPEFTFTPGGDIPDGAIAGQLASTATLGLISSACNQSLLVNFTMLDATLNKSVTTPFLDPQVKGGNPGGDTEGDLDHQFDIGNDGLPLGVTRYPDYLTRIFETQTPLARTYGQTEVSGIPVSLNFLLFAPGTVFQDGKLPTDPRLGYPSVTVLQSIGDPDAIPQPGAITDFCSPLVTKNTNFGITQDNPDTTADEGGVIRITNPSEAGTYTFATWAAGLRDADGDGWENLLDVCSLTANPGWDPRERVIAGQTGDIDGDALPDACDPFPNETGPISGGVFDEDRDQYGNRQDNCPLVANSFGSDVAGEVGTDNQADEDSDQIGDACDPNPNVEDGARPAICILSAIDIGAGGTPAVNPADLLPCNPSGTLPTNVGSPTPTLPPGATPVPTSSDGVDNPPDSGIGSLSPSGTGIPLWALLVAGVSLVGLLAGFGLSATSVRVSTKDE